MILSKTYDAFLALVHLGIGHEGCVLSQEIDWTAIKALADAHGLSAIVLDSIERLPESRRPPQVFLLEWIGEVLQNYEYLFDQYGKAISELAGFYNRHGYKMMALKGYACSLDWPNPKHRPCGDIDIWQFGEQKEADAVLAKEKGVKIDTSHHHHTVFEWDGFSVENHYDFINVHHHKSNAEFEKTLKHLGEDDSYTVEVKGEKVYLPSPNLHALFLLKHLMMHFASEGIMLRQVVDWGFFVEKHGKDIDWNYVLNVLDKFGMRQMFNTINAILGNLILFLTKLIQRIGIYSMTLSDTIAEFIGRTSSTLPSDVLAALREKYASVTRDQAQTADCRELLHAFDDADAMLDYIETCDTATMLPEQTKYL